MSRLRRAGLAASVIVSLLLAGGAARAVQPDEIMSDPRLEARARGISAELRCLVCQNQSIDDSDAPLARDLRLLVRDRLRAGDGDQGVRDFVVSRYGQFVLLRPSLDAGTILLWSGPFLIVGAAVAGLLAARSRRGDPAGPVALSDEERASLETILRGERP